MTMQYIAKEFLQHLHSAFSVQHAGSTVELTLAEVKSVQSTPQVEQFSLLLQGPPSPRLEQRIYSLNHEKTGPMDLFIVPVEQNERGLVYEVVISQLGKRD
jgi:hypothetical protein